MFIGPASPVAKLVVPFHLDGLEDSLVGSLRIVVEILQGDHPLVQVGEPHRERVRVRMRLHQRDGDVLRVAPFHGSPFAISARLAFGGGSPPSLRSGTISLSARLAFGCGSPIIWESPPPRRPSPPPDSRDASAGSAPRRCPAGPPRRAPWGRGSSRPPGR